MKHWGGGGAYEALGRGRGLIEALVGEGGDSIQGGSTGL